MSNHGLLGSLDSSHNLQANYTINFLFYLDLILHTCNILIHVIGLEFWFLQLNNALILAATPCQIPSHPPYKTNSRGKSQSCKSCTILQTWLHLGIFTLALFISKLQNFKRFVNRLHGVLNVVEKNRITQMDCKSRDESNEFN